MVVSELSTLSLFGSNESVIEEEILSQALIFESINNRSEVERCKFYRILDTYFNMSDYEKGWCPYYFDDFLCWRQTPPNTTLVMECPAYIRGIQYKSKYNVTRHCGPDGNWIPGNYSGCAAELQETDPPMPLVHMKTMYCIYWIGYTISLIFLLLALAVFIRYKKLWCLRNIIHGNLILCFALHNIIWIAYSLVAHEFMTKAYGLEELVSAYCYIPTTLLKYFIAAGFFWMFVEGVYLLFSVVFSFHAKSIRFWMCAIVGWVIPLFLIVITTSVKAKMGRTEECLNEQHNLDYIFIGPVLFLLLINVIFLIIIMYVVVTKLQVTVPVEATRYKKAIKALFILCPLLGVNYLFVLIQPNNPLWAKLIFSYYFSVTTSLQVWQTIRRPLRKWIGWMGMGENGSKKLRRSMRLDTQSSMMMDFETSSIGRPSRIFDLMAPNQTGKQQNRNQSKRSSNVIVMRDDGELRMFLPHALAIANGKKAGKAAKQASVDQATIQPIPGDGRPWTRYSLPVDPPTSVVYRNGPATANGTNSKDSAAPPKRRVVSNYRPVRGPDGIESAQARRTRYAYSSSDRTSVF